MEAVTVIDVPKSRRTTPPRSYQLDDPPWHLVGLVASALGMSRAALMKALALWYIRWPGAKLPPRLDPGVLASLYDETQEHFRRLDEIKATTETED